MAEKPPPPPPPPKGKPKAIPPPPPKKSPPPPPPAPKKSAPPPPPVPKKATPPPPGERPRAPPKGKRRAPPKGKPKGKRPAKKKKRRLRIKLGLKQSEISSEEEAYTDQIGWTVDHTTLQELESEQDKGPEIVTHQCSMCGSMMQIPKPKRERYKVVCAYPECGHADMLGL